MLEMNCLAAVSLHDIEMEMRVHHNRALVFTCHLASLLHPTNVTLYCVCVAKNKTAASMEIVSHSVR